MLWMLFWCLLLLWVIVTVIGVFSGAFGNLLLIAACSVGLFRLIHDDS